MRALILIFLFIFTVGSLQAQVIRAKVRIEYEHLPLEQQRDLEDLKQGILNYMNNYAWTDDEYETDIDVNIQVIIESLRQKSHEKIYRAQFLISSTSGEKFYDKDWEFTFQPGYVFEHDKVQIDPLCHFLDYYAYMILGGELDTYGLTLGTPYYDKALEIANRGVLSRYSRGWDNRAEELQKITNVRTRPLREAKPDFFEAEYYLQEGDLQNARSHALKVIAAIERVVRDQPNNKYLRLFFDAHYRTFVEIFRGDREVLQKLVTFDSNHRDGYRAAME